MKELGKSVFAEKKILAGLCISKAERLNGDYPLHTHDFHELVLIRSGSGVQVVNGKEYVITPGDLFVLRERDVHGFRAMRNLTLFNIGFQNSALAGFLDKLMSIPGFFPLFVLEPAARQFLTHSGRMRLAPGVRTEATGLMDRIEQEFHQQEPGSEIMLTSLFLHLVTLVSRQARGSLPEPGRHWPSLLRVLEHLETHYQEPVSLQTLSELVNMPASTLLHQFRKALNTTPIRYLNAFRVNKASDLLLNSTCSITQVALATGFMDSNYFSRTFRAFMKLSPRDFRKQYGLLVPDTNA